MEDISDSARKCVTILQNADTDSEKFAVLLVVAKTMKAEDCDAASLRAIFNAIGLDFVDRLLKTSEPVADCPPSIFQAFGLMLLSCFCSDESFRDDLISRIPLLSDFVANLGDSEDHCSMLDHVMQCFLSLASDEKGCIAIVEEDALPVLCKAVCERKHGYEMILIIIFNCVNKLGPRCWKDMDSFNVLMNKYSAEFENDIGEKKFELCRTLTALMHSYPKSQDSLIMPLWHRAIHNGLSDILFSKVAVPQMEAALRLSSIMIECLGVKWAIGDTERTKHFFFIFVHLVCIEVRMIVEDRDLEHIMEDSNLLVACFSSLESVITFLVNDPLTELDSEQKLQLHSAITGTMNAIIGFISCEAKQDMNQITQFHVTKQQLLFASIRVTSAWLAEETAALREEVYEILPFFIQMGNFTFNIIKEGNLVTPDILRFLLPALCHFTAEDKAREILLNVKFPKILLEYFSYHWKIFKQGKNADSHSALITICGIFMNIIVLERNFVSKELIFFELLQVIFRYITELENKMHNLVLCGNLAVVGLLLLRYYSSKVKSSETAIYRYLSSSIKFLWDAHNIEDSRDNSTLVVAQCYKRKWGDLMELWFLGMQALSSLLPQMAWVAHFILESGWISVILSTLIKIREGAIDASTKSAYENLLCCLIRSEAKIGEIMKTQGALQVCATHHMKELEVRQYLCDQGVPEPCARETVQEFLKCFRANPQDPHPGRKLDLDSWRRLLWAYALGAEWDYLTEKIYPVWKKARFESILFSDQVKAMLKTLCKKYKLALITNGPSKAQWEKINKIGAKDYFDVILVSGDLSVEKPDPAIFHLACDAVGMSPEDCIMVGDKLSTDIQGGINAGLAATIWVPLQDSDHPKPRPDFKIGNVCEILSLLSAKKHYFPGKQSEFPKKAEKRYSC